MRHWEPRWPRRAWRVARRASSSFSYGAVSASSIDASRQTWGRGRVPPQGPRSAQRWRFPQAGRPSVCAQTWWTDRRCGENAGRRSTGPCTSESRASTSTIRDVLRRYDRSPCKPWIVIDWGGDAIVMLDELVRGEGSVHRSLVMESTSARRWPHAPPPPITGKQRIVLRDTLMCPQPIPPVAVRAARVELDVRHDWCAKRANPVVNVVWVRELRPPRGQEPLDWMLFTNASVATAEDLRLVVRSYTMRWRIEDFHRDAGSQVIAGSKTQSSARSPRSKRGLPYSPRWLPESLKHLARNEPQAPATIELSDLEIEALKFMKLQRKKKTEVIGPGIPSIQLAVRWIADLGGYTGKSSGGPPGATTRASQASTTSPSMLPHCSEGSKPPERCDEWS